MFWSFGDYRLHIRIGFDSEFKYYKFDLFLAGTTMKQPSLIIIV